MNYTKIYNNLISKAKRENRMKDCGIYYENHHIIPKSFGGSDDTENLVLLTAKEHWIAHLLLARFSKGQNKYSAQQAVLNMGRVIPENKRKTSSLYENARKYISNEISKRHTGTLIVKDKETNIRIGRVPKDHPKVLSGEWVFFHLAEKRTDERKRKQSEASFGEKNSRYSGITDTEILESAYQYFLDNKCLPARKWQEFSGSTFGYPKSYSKFRFNKYGGGLKGFKKAMIELYKLTEEDFKYVITEEHKLNLSKSLKETNNGN